MARSAIVLGEEVEDSEYWVKFYGDDSRKCDQDLAKLHEAESHRIWIAQRKLDGDTPEEAEADYAEEVRIRIFICDMWRKLTASSRSDLERAKAHLSKLQSR